MKKKLLLIGGCVVVMLLAAGICMTMKCRTTTNGIGVLDEQQIVTKSTAFRLILGEEQKYNNALSARQAEDEKMLQSELNALEKKVKDSGKPQTAFKKEIEEFQQKVAFYNRKYQVQRNLIVRAAQAARQQLDPFVQETLSELGQKGYAIIISKTQVTYSNPKSDVTADFIKLLDAKKINIVFPDPVQFAVAQNAIAQQAAEKAAAKTAVVAEKPAPAEKATEPVKEAPKATEKKQTKETKK